MPTTPAFLYDENWITGLDGTDREIWIPLRHFRGIRLSHDTEVNPPRYVAEVNCGDGWWPITSPEEDLDKARDLLRGVVRQLQSIPVPLSGDDLTFEPPPKPVAVQDPTTLTAEEQEELFGAVVVEGPQR
jgi:hypothetical protein